MGMVDDATGTTLLLFSEEETTFAAMLLLEAWVKLYGIPVSLYVDRKKVYVTDREQTKGPQERDRSDQERPAQVGHDHEPLAVRAVDPRADHQAKQQVRQEGGHNTQGQADRRAGQLIHQQRQRDLGEGGAEVRDALPGPKLPEVGGKGWGRRGRFYGARLHVVLLFRFFYLRHLGRLSPPGSVPSAALPCAGAFTR